MQPLTRQDLMSLEDYARERPGFRARVMQHKKTRKVMLGEHVALFFEDRLTMQYQVQEMLRAERIFESEGIQEELDAYNPLIPDGSNFKATMMVQYDDVEERRRALARLIGIEDAVWIRVGENEKVHPIADEDLERETEEKTSSVHFLRFELNPDMVADAKSGAALTMGIDHPQYPIEPTELDAETVRALASDLD